MAAGNQALGQSANEKLNIGIIGTGKMAALGNRCRSATMRAGARLEICASAACLLLVALIAICGCTQSMQKKPTEAPQARQRPEGVHLGHGSVRGGEPFPGGFLPGGTDRGGDRVLRGALDRAAARRVALALRVARAAVDVGPRGGMDHHLYAVVVEVPR